jgi:membrane-associated phospholipid phosphatase
VTAKTRFLTGVLPLGISVFLVLNPTRAAAQHSDAPAKDAPTQNEVSHEPTAVPASGVSLPEVPDRATGRTGGSDDAPAEPRTARFTGPVKDFFQDQKQIWTSPARARFADATWLVPLAGLTAGLFATDRQFSASLPQNPSTLRHYRTVSDVGLASLAGAGAGLFLFSFPTHNEHWRETGLLAGEAAINALATTEAFKYSLRRQRPDQGDGGGLFFHGGTSFPSEHAAVAWSIAGVIAHEYPGTLSRLFAYGMASAVSFSRVRSRDHFPSDVLVGQALGYLIAQSVYSRRHDPELAGGAWPSPREFMEDWKTQSPSYMGSPYVPLDSWIYPALERLAALGYVKTAILGMRPWTRLECARLLSEAAEILPDDDSAGDRSAGEVHQLYDFLAREFSSEDSAIENGQGAHAQLESVYARALGISGTPLTDNEHFGQTILNDYGRPFQGGFNSTVGTSGWTTAGPFVIYARGEYQSAPSAPSLPQAALNFISGEDGLPPNPPLMPVAAISRFRLLDAYVGMTIANWEFSFGKQSLWWSPGENGALLMTNNTEPLNRMFRISRVSPFRLPSVFQYLGDMRLEFFLGRLSGHEFINNSGVFVVGAQGQYGQNLHPQPYLSGGKISFKFTENFEFSMSKTTIYGGPGNPLTFKTLFQSAAAVHVNGEPSGDGRSAIDFSYRIPKLRNWISLYGEGFTEDEISPINEPGKSAWQGGLYFAKVPRIPKLDFRLEGGFTDPVDFKACNACFYNNQQYLSGYTNNGVLIGTWIGRAAQGEAVSSTYWISPQKKISLEMRHRKIDRQYLPQGGTQNDVALNSDFLVKSGFRFSGTVQYERWQIPLLAANRQSNVTASFQLGYWPQARPK